MTFIVILNYTCTVPFSGVVAVIGVLDFGPRKNIHLPRCVTLVMRFRMYLNIHRESFRFLYILLLFLDVMRYNSIIVWFVLLFYCCIFLYFRQGAQCHSHFWVNGSNIIQ